MTTIEGLLIFFSIIFAYIIIVKTLNNKGTLQRYNMSLAGPFLMIRTTKGKKFVEKIAQKKRFWKAFGSFSIVYCFIAMAFMAALLIWQLVMLFFIDLTPTQKAGLPGPESILPIPGINVLLPLEIVFYFLIALLVALIAHEFSHGILSYAGKIKVKSLGLLYLILPIGAFCEPDEEDLKKTKTTNRMRIYAAGPMSNFVVAFIALLIFSFVFMSAVQPVDGVEIFTVSPNTPAEEIGLSKSMVITSINNTKINNGTDFFNVLNNTQANQTITITYTYRQEEYTEQATLIDKYDVYYQEYLDYFGYVNQSTKENLSYLKNKGYLGVGPNPYNSSFFIDSLKNPFSHDFPNGFLNTYFLPFYGFIYDYNPLASSYYGSFQITGPLSVLPFDVFWIIANILFWIFWLNLAVGLFNILPIYPLDGGILYYDALNSLVKKIKKDMSDEKRERIVKRIAIITSLFILFIAIFPFFFKYI
jgi:membrane-associated protease RseP (regulator of RpoE activity)